MHKAILKKEMQAGDIIKDFIICPIGEIKQGEKERYIIGLASTPTKDRYGDIILPEAFREGLENYLKNPILLLNHDPLRPIGRVEKIDITSQGLYIKARLANDNKDSDYAWNLIRQGILNGLSICTYNNIKSEEENGVRRITYWDLAEISVVSIPANPHSVIENFLEGEEDEAKKSNPET